MRDNFFTLPNDLPVPTDDGACDHLWGATLPELQLPSTQGRLVNLAEVAQSRAVFFFYPRSGRPDEPLPVGWDEIPGARGCTPQSCGYRDRHNAFAELGAQVFGVSTQTPEYQRELAERIHLPYEILSDADFALTEALKLPTFEYRGMRLLKRMAWICEGGEIRKVFYPVFPPDKNAETVLASLRELA